MVEFKRIIWFDPGGRVVHLESSRDRDVHMACGSHYPVEQVREYCPEDPVQHYRPDCRGCFGVYPAHAQGH